MDSLALPRTNLPTIRCADRLPQKVAAQRRRCSRGWSAL